MAEDINLPGRLDRVSDYLVRIKFAEDLATDVKIWVHADTESKAPIDAYNKAQQKPDAEGSGRRCEQADLP